MWEVYFGRVHTCSWKSLVLLMKRLHIPMRVSVHDWQGCYWQWSPRKPLKRAVPRASAFCDSLPLDLSCNWVWGVCYRIWTIIPVNGPKAMLVACLGSLGRIGLQCATIFRSALCRWGVQLWNVLRSHLMTLPNFTLCLRFPVPEQKTPLFISTPLCAFVFVML